MYVYMLRMVIIICADSSSEWSRTEQDGMGREGEVCIESHDEQKEEIEMVSHIRTGCRSVSWWLMMMADGKTTNVDGDANTKDEGISLQSVLGLFLFLCMLGTVSSFGSQQFPGGWGDVWDEHRWARLVRPPCLPSSTSISYARKLDECLCQRQSELLLCTRKHIFGSSNRTRCMYEIVAIFLFLGFLIQQRNPSTM